MKYTSNLDRTDLGFDRYFEKCLKEGTRSSRRKVHSIYLKEILLKSFTKWLTFLKNYQNKNKLKKYLSLKLLELHQGDQIMIATY